VLRIKDVWKGLKRQGHELSTSEGNRSNGGGMKSLIIEEEYEGKELMGMTTWEAKMTP